MHEFRIFRALGLSVRAWFQNFIPFTLLAAVLYSPIVIRTATYNPQDASAEDLLNQFFLYPIYFLVGVSTLVAPLLTYRVIQDLNGTKVSILTSIKFGLRGILPALFLAVITNGLQRVPGVGGIISAVVTCIWFVVTPAAVAEKLNPFAAFSRSAALTAGRRWGIFGLTFLIGLVVVILLFAWIIPMFEHVSNAADAAAQIKQSAVVLVLVMGVFQLFNGIVQAVSYALLRKDKDGVSYEELSKVFE